MLIQIDRCPTFPILLHFIDVGIYIHIHQVLLLTIHHIPTALGHEGCSDGKKSAVGVPNLIMPPRISIGTTRTPEYDYINQSETGSGEKKTCIVARYIDALQRDE